MCAHVLNQSLGKHRERQGEKETGSARMGSALSPSLPLTPPPLSLSLSLSLSPTMGGAGRFYGRVSGRELCCWS